MVLMHNKHISSNSVDNWQDFLHQPHVLIMPVILAPISLKIRLINRVLQAQLYGLAWVLIA